MAQFVIESVPAHLAGSTYYLDEEKSHIEVNQKLARATGAGALLERVCPIKVYSVEADGTVGAEYTARLEYGTCLAVALKGMFKWHYPCDSFGIMFHED